MEAQMQQPALATPQGVASSFPNTWSDARIYYYPMAILSTVVPGILFILRIYTKLRIIGKLDLTDITISLAWPLFITLVVLAWGVVLNGGGAHLWNIRNADFINIGYYYYVFEIVYCPCMFLVKAAILMQYQRTFAPRRSMDPFMWWATKIVIAANGIFYFSSTFFTIFSCRPRQAAWNPLIKDGKCLDNNLSIIFTCVFNILSDTIILLLPTRAVWKLQIPTRKKASIVALFALGLLAVICDSLIISYFFEAASTGDISYNLSWAGFWAIADVSIGFIVSSAIILPRYLKAKGPVLKGYCCLASRVSGHSKGRMSGNFSNGRNGERSHGEMLPLSSPYSSNHIRLTTPFGEDDGGSRVMMPSSDVSAMKVSSKLPVVSVKPSRSSESL